MLLPAIPELASPVHLDDEFAWKLVSAAAAPRTDRGQLLAALFAEQAAVREWFSVQCPPQFQQDLADWAAEKLIALLQWPEEEAAGIPQIFRRLLRAEQLEQQFELRLDEEKLTALYHFAYGASHEINNPLANVATRAQTLLREETHPQRRQELATILAQAMRAHEMISDAMLFARPAELHLQEVLLKEIVQTAAAEWSEQAALQNVEILLRFDNEEKMIEADPGQLTVALSAVCRNALEAMQTGGRLEMATVENKILVRDTGPGIGEGVRRFLFDPFYSGREAGRGLGLGLSKAWRILQLHGGRLEIGRPETGAEFLLCLTGKD